MTEATDADALHSLARAACEAGRLPEGIAYARQALALDPQRARTHLLLGMALAGAGRPAEALASFDRAIVLAPERADAHGNRGDVLVELRRPTEAIDSYDRALKIDPKSLENWCNRAATLVDLGRHAEALTSYDQALALKPDHVEVLAARGVVLNALGRRLEAIESLDRVLARAPHHRVALRTRGVALLDLDRLEEALATFERALALAPDDTDARYNVGFTLAALERDTEALAAFDKVLALNPGHTDALMGRGAALQNLARYAEAVATYERVVAIDPKRAAAHYTEGMALLSLGDYRSGLPKYEWRPTTLPPVARPLWRGESPLAGKTLLVQAEQGLGDVLYAVRYVPLLAQSGARVVLQVHPPLKDLLSRLAGVAAIVGKGEPTPPFDCQCPVMSLPYALKTEPGSIPADVPYVKAPPERVAQWRDRLPEEGKLRVGLVWCGNPAFKENRRRSLELTQVAPLFAIPGVAFYSLNPGIGANDVAALVARPNVRHIGNEFRDFSDTAAAVALLDLVLTSDTSVAHLAGAMGRPVWIMLGFSPDWRWASDRDHSPWYPTARLFRQATPGDWAGVIEQVAGELVALSCRQ